MVKHEPIVQQRPFAREQCANFAPDFWLDAQFPEIPVFG
jgi:hypothetical protein